MIRAGVGVSIEVFASEARADGINTVIIALDGLNSPGESVDIMKQKVQVANGTVYESLTFWSLSSSVIDNARQAGSQIAP